MTLISVDQLLILFNLMAAILALGLCLTVIIRSKRQKRDIPMELLLFMGANVITYTFFAIYMSMGYSVAEIENIPLILGTLLSLNLIYFSGFVFGGTLFHSKAQFYYQFKSSVRVYPIVFMILSVSIILTLSMILILIEAILEISLSISVIYWLFKLKKTLNDASFQKKCNFLLVGFSFALILPLIVYMGSYSPGMDAVLKAILFGGMFGLISIGLILIEVAFFL